MEIPEMPYFIFPYLRAEVRLGNGRLNRITVEEKLQNPEFVRMPIKRFVVNTFGVLDVNRTPFLRYVCCGIMFLRNITKPGVSFDLEKSK